MFDPDEVPHCHSSFAETLEGSSRRGILIDLEECRLTPYRLVLCDLAQMPYSPGVA